jgi:hypothetical protein
MRMKIKRRLTKLALIKMATTRISSSAFLTVPAYAQNFQSPQLHSMPSAILWALMAARVCGTSTAEAVRARVPVLKQLETQSAVLRLQMSRTQTYTPRVTSKGSLSQLSAIAIRRCLSIDFRQPLRNALVLQGTLLPTTFRRRSCVGFVTTRLPAQRDKLSTRTLVLACALKYKQSWTCKRSKT